MRYRDEQTLKEVIDKMLQSYKIVDKVKEVEIVQSWERMMGHSIAKYTEKIFVRNSCLYIKITSAPLKQELFYAREKIKENLNKELGTEVIKNVVLI